MSRLFNLPLSINDKEVEKKVECIFLKRITFVKGKCFNLDYPDDILMYSYDILIMVSFSARIHTLLFL